MVIFFYTSMKFNLTSHLALDIEFDARFAYLEKMRF